MTPSCRSKAQEIDELFFEEYSTEAQQSPPPHMLKRKGGAGAGVGVGSGAGMGAGSFAGVHGGLMPRTPATPMTMLSPASPTPKSSADTKGGVGISSNQDNLLADEERKRLKSDDGKANAAGLTTELATYHQEETSMLQLLSARQSRAIERLTKLALSAGADQAAITEAAEVDERC